MFGSHLFRVPSDQTIDPSVDLIETNGISLTEWTILYTFPNGIGQYTLFLNPRFSDLRIT